MDTATRTLPEREIPAQYAHIKGWGGRFVTASPETKVIS